MENNTQQINKKKAINTSAKDIMLSKLRVKFDITTLNMIIAFIYKDSVLRTRKTLTNILRLVENLDESTYIDNPNLEARIWVIRNTLDAKLKQGIDNTEMLKLFCKDLPECDELKSSIIDDIEFLKISHDESKFLIRKLDDIIEYGYTSTIKDIMLEILHSIDDGDYRSYKSVSDDLYAISTAVINIKRKAVSLGSDNMFSLDDDVFESVVVDAVNKLKDRNRILMTGIQRLNTILAPGYMSKRLYTYLAFPGKGKSTILLKSALDCRKYNQEIKTKDPDKRPAVLMLTLENDVPETIERLYNMAVEGGDIRNYTPKQIIKKMREKGGLRLTKENNIDIIIKEYKNRELDTNDLYSIIQDMEDDGVEVICLIVDYLKRIRPAEKASDEKGELKNITNELKELAKFFDIPVISAQQLNRSGASVVDAALQANKEDVTRLVGRDAVATAWEIIENSDVVIVINPEVKADTDALYLVFKLLKRRYRSVEEDERLRRLDYFAHPFEEGNEIRLIDDVDMEKPLSLESLSTKFVPVDDKRGKKNAMEREEKDGKKKEKRSNNMDDLDSFDSFDPTCSRNF